MSKRAFFRLIQLLSQVCTPILGLCHLLFLDESHGVAQSHLIGLGQAEILSGHRVVADVVVAHLRRSLCWHGRAAKSYLLLPSDFLGFGGADYRAVTASAQLVLIQTVSMSVRPRRHPLLPAG